MANTDFIWVVCSCCPQEGSRCWVEGQVLHEKLLPIAPVSLLRRGWSWLSALHSGAEELQHPPLSLTESCSDGRALGNSVWFLPSSGALGQQSWTQGAYTTCLQWLHGAMTQLLEKHQGCEPWGAQYGLGWIALDLEISLDGRWEILSQERLFQRQGPGCAQNLFLFFSLVTMWWYYGIYMFYQTEFSRELIRSSSKGGFTGELFFCAWWMEFCGLHSMHFVMYYTSILIIGVHSINDCRCTLLIPSI